jgi:hypothetical protein
MITLSFGFAISRLTQMMTVTPGGLLFGTILAHSYGGKMEERPCPSLMGASTPFIVNRVPIADSKLQAVLADTRNGGFASSGRRKRFHLSGKEYMPPRADKIVDRQALILKGDSLQVRTEDQTATESILKKSFLPFFEQASETSRFVWFFAAILIIMGMILGTSAYAVDVTLAWDPNTEPDLDGYTVYYSKGAPGPPYDYAGDLPLGDLADPDNPQVTLTELEELTNYYFALTAYDINGNESSFSSSICIFIDGVVQECAPDSEVGGDVGGDIGSAVGGGGSSGGGGCFIGASLDDAATVAGPMKSIIVLSVTLTVGILVSLVLRQNWKSPVAAKGLHFSFFFKKGPSMDD